ncbi:MAG: cadmium-translocating P-type ATPase [Treponema sp.]|jgi:Cd2+/Zn2+-exporting ATPase|nr:cadmium-translocating P-type ATPase [Treponema sp.]
MNQPSSTIPAYKEIYLSGLCCPQCAEKIRTQVSRLGGINSPNLDFVSQKLTFELVNPQDSAMIIQQITDIVTAIEPDIHLAFAGKPDQEATENPWTKRLYYIRMGAGIALFILGLLCSFSAPIPFAVFLTSYILIGGEVILHAIKNITKGQVFDENFLMSVASIGAFAIGEYPEGVAVMLFYQIGEAFQELAVNRSRKSITKLMDIRPDFANLKTSTTVRKVNPEVVQVGDCIVVKPGEKIPLDGTVIEGYSVLDTAALTGESLPQDVAPGHAVLSGSINKNGLLTIEVTKVFGESTVSKILHLVQTAGSKKAPIENFITKFARYYTPLVVSAAVLLALIPPLCISGAEFSLWLNRALVFLVVSCPCALVISIPLSFFGGIGGASKNGILIKGSNYLDALNMVETIVFDKTGTLTKGVFKVTTVVTEKEWTADELLCYAAYAESNSNHPIAISIQKAYGKAIDPQKITAYEEIAGKGIRVQVSGKLIVAGNHRLLADEHITVPAVETYGTVVYLAIDMQYAGYLVIADEIKQDSKQTIAALKTLGIKNVMLTGDTKKAGEKVAAEIGLDQVYTELLPHQKVEQLERLQQDKTPQGTLVFVGDGINDAPVLACSDIGIAMGGVGSDAAIEASDIVLMTDEPSKLLKALAIAKKTRTIVMENIVFALGVKAVILILGAMGIATMWAAVFGDVGVAIIAILNAMRAMR